MATGDVVTFTHEGRTYVIRKVRALFGRRKGGMFYRRVTVINSHGESEHANFASWFKQPSVSEIRAWVKAGSKRSHKWRTGLPFA